MDFPSDFCVRRDYDSDLCGIAEDSLTANNVFDECEIHENCTVEIWKNSTTGEVSIGWWENEPN